MANLKTAAGILNISSESGTERIHSYRHTHIHRIRRTSHTVPVCSLSFANKFLYGGTSIRISVGKWTASVPTTKRVRNLKHEKYMKKKWNLLAIFFSFVLSRCIGNSNKSLLFF